MSEKLNSGSIKASNTIFHKSQNSVFILYSSTCICIHSQVLLLFSWTLISTLLFGVLFQIRNSRTYREHGAAGNSCRGRSGNFPAPCWPPGNHTPGIPPSVGPSSWLSTPPCYIVLSPLGNWRPSLSFDKLLLHLHMYCSIYRNKNTNTCKW